jgi:5S rRNA maturation endonuclease (ribonuclease M5)
MGRTKHNYLWHKENIRKHKENGEPLVLRYRNSTGTDFDSILGGYDEITDTTHTVIIVEGLFDKINVDRLLELDKSEDVKCCFTFGNSVSDGQQKLLRNKKSVDTVILFYDYDAFKQSRTYGLVLNQYFKTFVAEITDPNIDPGDMNIRQINSIFSKLYTALEYYTKIRFK